MYMDTDLVFESDGTEEEEMCSWDPIRCMFTVDTNMCVPTTWCPFFATLCWLSGVTIPPSSHCLVHHSCQGV